MTREIQLSQGKVALVDDEDYPLINQYKWHARKKPSGTWYAIRSKNKKYVAIFMHRLILNIPEGFEVDHINGDGLDNRHCNLRIATHSQNHMNIKKYANKSSIFKGVCWDKQTNKWIVHIRLNRVMIHLGRFSDEVEAAREYDAKAKELFGEYAKLNFNDE